MTESTTASSAPTSGSSSDGGAKSASDAAQSAKAAAGEKAKAAASGAKRAAADPPTPPQRSVAQIQADIASNQQKLAQTVDEISDRIAPQALADEAKSRVKGIFVHPDGSPKGKPIAIIGGTIAGLVVLRAIFHD